MIDSQSCEGKHERVSEWKETNGWKSEMTGSRE